MRHILLLAVTAAAVATTVACAQPRGMGPGPGMGPGMGPGPGASSGMGPGMMGPGRGMGARWGDDYTPGWSMMTPEERDEHHRRMAGVRTYDECRQAMEEHRALMQKRAAERGAAMPAPRRDACAGLSKP